jgi:hypothetical protein
MLMFFNILYCAKIFCRHLSYNQLERNHFIHRRRLVVSRV